VIRPLERTRLLIYERKVLYFDGVDDYVRVPYNDIFDLTDIATFEGFIYRLSTGERHDIMGRGGTTWHAIVVTDFDHLNFQIRDNTGWPSTNSKSKIYANKWYHFAITVNWRTPSEGALVNFYIDGTFDIERTLPYDTKRTRTNPIYVGRLTSYFYGYIAFVRIYSRTLSPQEIQWNYLHPDNPVRGGLVLWLHWDSIDEDEGVWYDKSGYENHGTIYGATPVVYYREPSRKQVATRVLEPVR